MPWGTVELEPEVAEWLLRSPTAVFGRVSRYIDLLADSGAELGEPHSRQLRGKLRELRFNVKGERFRITYFIREGRRIVLLTVFKKRRRREPGEISRAARAMERCIAEDHKASGEA